MIRNVVMGRVSAVVTANDRERLNTAIAGIVALNLPGCVSMNGGLDIGLREGGWDFAITNDWVDEDAYRNYDRDPEHNAHRAVVGELAEALARVQFHI